MINADIVCITTEHVQQETIKHHFTATSIYVFEYASSLRQMFIIHNTISQCYMAVSKVTKSY